MLTYRTTYIAFLRGINVGGHRVTMDVLRRLFTELGLTSVRTYIQTGNVFFEAPAQEDCGQLTARMEQHLQQALGYAVPTFLRTPEELEYLLALNPFRHLTVTDEMRLCLVFLSEPAPAGLVLPLRSSKADMEIVHLTAREAFVVWYIIEGRAPATMSFLNKTLGRRTTTRFFIPLVKFWRLPGNSEMCKDIRYLCDLFCCHKRVFHHNIITSTPIHRSTNRISTNYNSSLSRRLKIMILCKNQF